MNVQLFIPCFVDQLYPQSAFNMIKVLEKAGCTVSYNTNQTCCGQAAFNAGFSDEAKAVAEKFMNDFGGTDYIVGPSASCVGYIRNYVPGLFINDDSAKAEKIGKIKDRIFEFTEFLNKVLQIEDFGSELQGKATYHDSCAALRECRIKEGPRRLLANVKGLELVEMNDVETCCGFGGTFSVKYPGISAGMAEQKADNIIATDAQYLISTDLSCIMNIEGVLRKKNKDIRCMHIADVLASGW